VCYTRFSLSPASYRRVLARWCVGIRGNKKATLFDIQVKKKKKELCKRCIWHVLVFFAPTLTSWTHGYSRNSSSLKFQHVSYALKINSYPFSTYVLKLIRLHWLVSWVSFLWPSPRRKKTSEARLFIRQGRFLRLERGPLVIITDRKIKKKKKKKELKVVWASYNLVQAT